MMLLALKSFSEESAFLSYEACRTTGMFSTYSAALALVFHLTFDALIDLEGMRSSISAHGNNWRISAADSGHWYLLN